MAKGKKKTTRDDDYSDTGTGSTAEKEEPKGMSRKKKERGDKGCKTFSSDEEEEGMSMYFEALTEKRTATREAALISLQEIIRREVMCDELEDRSVELATLLISSIKKGNPKEVLLAADVLALMFVALQASCQEVFDLAEEALCGFAKTLKHEAVKGKILEALALGSWACGQDPSDASVLMASIESHMLAPKATNLVIQPALRAWALVASSLPDAFIFDRIRRLLSVLDAGSCSLLEHEHVDVRVAAAEAASVLYEACWRYDPHQAKKVLQDYCDAEEEALSKMPALEDQISEFEKFAAKMERKMEEMGLTGEEVDEFDIDLDLMKKKEEEEVVLSKQVEGDGEDEPRGLKRSGSVKGMKQLDRKNEKTALRMARATMQGGTGPVIEKIKVRGFTLEVVSWRSRTWLNAVRAVLQSGLQRHLSANAFLHEVFHIDAASANMTALEMREDSLELRRSQAKSSSLVQKRDRDIDKARRKKEEFCEQVFLAEEADDSST